MKKLTIGLSLAALVIGGGAYAQQAQTGKWGGDMSRAEAQTKATEMFAKLDVNKDGKLDQADRTARMTQMFDRIDSDHNGQISRTEFVAGHERGPGGGPDEAMGPGKEGKHGRMGGHHGGRHHGGRMGDMMGMARMADTNQDGAITQTEFTAAALQRFDQADANKDGTVTKAERKTAHEQMRAKWREMRGAPDASPSSGT